MDYKGNKMEEKTCCKNTTGQKNLSGHNIVKYKYEDHRLYKIIMRYQMTKKE